MVLWNVLDGGPSCSEPLLGPSESMRDDTPGTKPRQYARLKTFLLNHGYVMGSVDKTLFTLKHDNDFLLGQIYMDDIILWLF
jgi:hypothetical protein